MLIDGEAIVGDATGLAVFSLIRSYRNGPRATFCAFDLIEIDGEDLRWRPIEDRKAALKKLIGDDASRHCVQQAFRRRGNGRVPSCLQARLRGHRVEAARFAISVRPIDLTGSRSRTQRRRR